MEHNSNATQIHCDKRVQTFSNYRKFFLTFFQDVSHNSKHPGMKILKLFYHENKAFHEKLEEK